MRYWFNGLLIIILIGCKTDEQVLSIQIESKVDTTLARIGDIITFDVISHFADDRILLFPDMQENESMEIRSKSILKTYDLSDRVKFEIVFWDTGGFTIPEYPVQVLNADSTVDFTIKTDSVNINVISMLAGTDDRSLRPIKDPVALKEPLDWYKWLLILVLIVLVLILFGLWQRRIKKPQLEKISVSEKQSAKDIAIVRLDELQKLIKVDCKTFYLHLSFMIREFIENQYYIRALEMTTGEIRKFRDALDLDNDFIGIINILNRADLAKFAKYEFNVSERQSDFDWISNFISNINEE